jgi:ketosteroid isomerase-like protein
MASPRRSAARCVMSAENVERLRRGYEHFLRTGELLGENVAPDFVWDMSTFRGWPEKQTYEGLEGAREFIADWGDAWDEWRLDLLELKDAGEEVVAIMHQRGRSKATGVEVDMDYAQVWTFEAGQQTRMRMYADPQEALRAAGLDVD